MVFSGSHDATRRWLRARATFALLRIMSDSLFERAIVLFLGVCLALLKGNVKLESVVLGVA